jgi:hypothetical protein
LTPSPTTVAPATRRYNPERVPTLANAHSNRLSDVRFDCSSS